MSTARLYKKYPEAVRLQIAESKNPYLFPEYDIPRTTALYWISNSRGAELATVTDNSLTKRKIKSLELQLQSANALRSLVEKVRAIFPHSFGDKRVTKIKIRRKIVEYIKVASKFNTVGECLDLIGISKSTYSNWLSEFYLCKDLSGRCKQRKPHQLTHEEIEVMRKLILSKKYRHLSIQSLCLLAQREGMLFCSLDSWYKYKKIFEWKRPQDLKREKANWIGIRAKSANEIWHIDVTQVKLPNKQKVYVQAIYDNFSRYILAWKVTPDVSAINTVDLIKAAKFRATELGNVALPVIMSDGGSENNNHKVLNFMNSKNIQRMIARVDIHFSNSMVESLFRMLKSNFLRFEVLETQRDVERKVDFYFTELNDIIPRHAFNGATPQEKFLNTWSDLETDKLRAGIRSAADLRKSAYLKRSCSLCKNSNN
jgi:putative transposase